MEPCADYVQKVSRWLQGCTGLPPDDADDLAMEAFARCLSRLRQRYPSAPAELLVGQISLALMRKVAHDLWVDWVREREHEQDALCRYAVANGTSPLSEAQWLDYHAALEVLERLEPFWQDVLWWRVGGYCWEEIARWTGRRTGTLSSGLERALDRACAELGYFRKNLPKSAEKRLARTD